MKNIIFLITLFWLAGCTGPQHVQHVPNRDTHPIVTTKDVPVEITTTIPPRDHTGTGISYAGEGDTTLVWEWDDARTEITIQPREAGDNMPATPREAAVYSVKTTVKAKTITLRDTLHLIDTMELVVLRYPGVDSIFMLKGAFTEFLYTATNDFECPGEGVTLPPPPAIGDWWKWLLYVIGAVALIFTVGKKKRKAPKNRSNGQA